jgi:peptidoglycan/LPS O-acetylase OafA/YrhL
MTPPTSRWVFIDALRAVASQLIVLHHLAFYGPMSSYAELVAPRLVGWFHAEARIVVQMFFVIGGFLAVKSLAPTGTLRPQNPLRTIYRRYLLLGIPFLVAILLSIPCASVARTLLPDPSLLPDAPTFLQMLAHMFFLQNILGYDGLSAGIWYVAIDFQLFTLLLGCLWLVRGRWGMLLVAGLGVCSLFYFNLNSAWDIWALYFFGAYSLGVFAFWLTDPQRSSSWLLVLAGVGGASLLFDYRSRIALALVTALVLGLGRRLDFLHRFPQSRIISWLGEISYSVFLIHFPVCLVINTLVVRYAGQNPAVNLTGMALAWVLSTVAGAVFYRYVESPVRRKVSTLR